jgi:hypothetical protein
MLELISQYNNDIIKSARIQTGIFKPKSTAEFIFISGKRLSIKPTHPVKLNIIVELNGIGLLNPGFREDNTDMIIHGGSQDWLGATNESLAGVRMMRVRTIEVYRNSNKLISPIKIVGDIDCNRFGKRLNFASQYVAGVVPMSIMLSPYLADPLTVFTHMKDDIGLMVD